MWRLRSRLSRALSTAAAAAAPPSPQGRPVLKGGWDNVFPDMVASLPVATGFVALFGVGAYTSSLVTRRDVAVKGLEERLAALEEKLGEKITGLGGELGEKMNGLERKLGKEMAGLERKLGKEMAGVVMNARSEAKAAALEVVKGYNVSVAGGAASKS
jgi:hypothetical protein